MEGGENSIFLPWIAVFPLSLNPTSPLLVPQGIQCPCHIFLLPLQPLDTSGRASARGKAAHAGQRRALEHTTVLPTVDTALPSTSSLPLVPVEVPRCPQHATELAPSSLFLLLPPLARAPAA